MDVWTLTPLKMLEKLPSIFQISLYITAEDVGCFICVFDDRHGCYILHGRHFDSFSVQNITWFDRCAVIGSCQNDVTGIPLATTWLCFDWQEAPGPQKSRQKHVGLFPYFCRSKTTWVWHRLFWQVLVDWQLKTCRLFCSLFSLRNQGGFRQRSFMSRFRISWVAQLCNSNWRVFLLCGFFILTENSKSKKSKKQLSEACKRANFRWQGRGYFPIFLVSFLLLKCLKCSCHVSDKTILSIAFIILWKTDQIAV